MNLTTRIGTALIGLSALVALAACGTDTPRAETTATATITESAPASTSAIATEGAADTGATDVDAADDPTSGGGNTPQQEAPAQPCGPRTLPAASIAAAMATVPTDGPGYSWVPGASNFSTCNDISYVVLDTAAATAASPWQLMIFDRTGKYLGTGIKCNATFQSIVGSGPDRIDVRYRYLRDGEPNAAPSGTATVTFRWNGSRVVMDGTLPAGVTLGRC